jgi:hypothetical protein
MELRVVAVEAALVYSAGRLARVGVLEDRVDDYLPVGAVDAVTPERVVSRP